ncbi:hypothetical protein BSN85_17240 [Bradyrhizobium brasilense]|uniref:DUF3987 domain-containing protein n=1 Tax=Bradyrhizobium brasilense TaxID=1419277 RepID=UPI0009773DA5|nr:DUF3987 domain-containing protein [Bradyrhizobium brasilense]OMI09276.1 hypothetical protein BSN85_17240 [Bradyrhizobium brasilense]
MSDQTASESTTGQCRDVTAVVIASPEACTKMPTPVEEPTATSDARITATVTNSNPAAQRAPTSATDKRKFLENVLVWPGSDQAPGWINLHVNVKNTTPAKNGGKPWVVGWPFKTVDDVLSRASWVESTAGFFNVWVCMSQQSTCITKDDGKRKAVRKAANATLLKAIWIDCDVKPGDAKHYSTIQEAWAAIRAFQKKVGLPAPSILVNSGGGLHIYWVSDAPLSVDEWRGYAQGLKALLLQEGVLCDTGLTTDAARILRVPGTLNHKYNPPRPVQLLHCGSSYNFSEDIGFLRDINVSVTSTPQHDEHGNFGAPDPAFASLKPDDALQAGATGSMFVDPRPIFAATGCGFLREALRTGGRDYDQPQWNLSVLCTAFMENGNDIAHKISSGHTGYTTHDTQALYDRKVADRAERGIGYPSCAAIHGAGSARCAGCQHFSKGKSPLNIRRAVTATVTPPPEHDFTDPYEEFGGPPFPFEVLSPRLRKFVDATAKALGADPSAVAMASLAAVSGAMNAETTVRLSDDWLEKPIIWVLLVGPPSSLKSPIIDKATRPLRRIDQERVKLYREQHARWFQDKKNIPVPSAPPRCVINDATPEKVTEILSRAPCGSLSVQDEVAGWIESFERYNSPSRAFYLQTWNGGTFTKDRVGKGRDDLGAEICIDNLALSILGGIQPDKLTKIGDLTDDGLLQRFLAILMKSSGLPDTYTLVGAAAGDYEQLIRSINAAPAQQFKFDDDACEVRDDVLRRLHDLEKVDGFPTSLLAAIGKLKGYFGRLCLVLQVTKIHDPTEHGDNDAFTPEDAALMEKLCGLVPDNSLSAGINYSQSVMRDTAEQVDKLIREFLLPHLFGFYDGVVNGGRERHKLRDLADFVLSTDKDRLRPSDFTAGVRSLRGEPDHRIREWAGRLCAMGWLDPEEGKPAAPTKAWCVATGLREHFLQRREQARAARAEAHRILKAGGSRSARKSL